MDHGISLVFFGVCLFPASSLRFPKLSREEKNAIFELERVANGSANDFRVLVNAAAFVSSHDLQQRGKLTEDFGILLELREKLLEIERRGLRLGLTAKTQCCMTTKEKTVRGRNRAWTAIPVSLNYVGFTEKRGIRCVLLQSSE